MLKNLINGRNYQMKKLLEDTANLRRLQNYIDYKTNLFLIKEYSSAETNHVISYLTGDYAKFCDEYELSIIREELDYGHYYIAALTGAEVMSIISALTLSYEILEDEVEIE